jgi:hypothetical protein
MISPRSVMIPGFQIASLRLFFPNRKCGGMTPSKIRREKTECKMLVYTVYHVLRDFREGPTFAVNRFISDFDSNDACSGSIKLDTATR